MSAHRLVPSPWHVSSSERLHLLLAGLCAVSATGWGLAMAVVVLVVLACRRRARGSLERSAAVRRGVLTPAQRTGLLDPPCHRREAVARA